MLIHHNVEIFDVSERKHGGAMATWHRRTKVCFWGGDRSLLRVFFILEAHRAGVPEKWFITGYYL